jgi:hypothetical protein
MAERIVVYREISADKLERIVKALVDAGVVLQNEHTTAEYRSGNFDAGHGFTVEYDYDYPSAELKLNIKGSWALMPVAVNKLDSYIHPFLNA